MTTRWTAHDTELVVLACLAGRPLYGYLISKHVASTEGGPRLSPGQLYPMLARLERQGLVTAAWDEVKSDRRDAPGPGRRRKWYRLSPKGRRRLEQRVKAHRAYAAVMSAFIDRADATPEADP